MLEIDGDVRSGAASVWWREEVGREDQLVALRGRRTDLIVVGRPAAAMDQSAFTTLHAAIFETARPVLLTPAAKPDSIGRKIAIAWNGSIIVVGFAAGTIEKIPANLILLKNVAVTGVHWGAYTRNEPDKIGETWEALLNMFKTKKIVPTVFEHIYEGLESVPQGLKDLADRKTWGKAIVRIRADPQYPPKGKHKL